MVILLLAAILLLSQGIQSQDNVTADPLTKLDDIVTSRLKEGLKDLWPSEYAPYYLKLQQIAELPISQLDEKVKALNMVRFLIQSGESFNTAETSGIQNQTLSKENPALKQLTDKQFNKKVIKLLKRLGIYDNFTDRVFRAIFSDEKQLRKLKKKLADLDKDDEDKDTLWEFVFNLF
ncbi:uncharacterized protein LOC108094489 [Drosophila ficusphila]|uniref:uncharacterized protein LOC108094489 n=1 Tax=Drosophila ficusphila TaxID=30025 RepID=UPI001C89F28B|nr:uncharacterized protein LOC108094489 [Drosophila ficusphila]